MGKQQKGMGNTAQSAGKNSRTCALWYDDNMDRKTNKSFFTDELAEVKKHKQEFLEQINQLIPWQDWVAMVKPCYDKGERGNKPYDPELMLRIYVLQILYNLSDIAVTAQVVDSRAFADFCSVTSSVQIPDSESVSRFRNLLIRNELQEQLLANIVHRLKRKGVRLSRGTVVDFALVAAPSSVDHNRQE